MPKTFPESTSSLRNGVGPTFGSLGHLYFEFVSYFVFRYSYLVAVEGRLIGICLLCSRLRRIANSGFMFLVCLCSVLLHANVCRGADEAIPIDDLRVPLEYYEDGRIKSQLFSDSAKVAAEGDIEALSPRVEFYGKDGNVEILMKAEECRYNKDNRTAVSKSNVCLEKEDTVITGTGLDWDAKKGSVKILDNARVVLNGGIRKKRPEALAEEESLSAQSFGMEEEGTNRTVITSEHLTFDYKRSIAVFEENVVVVDPQIRIDSDKMNVLFNEDNSVKSITALGNVHLWHQDKTATCRRAIYFARTGEVILMGKAVLRDPKGLAEGDEIRYLIDEGKVSCKPARLVIFPQAKNNRKNFNRR